jgi:hypothetical protein
MGPPIALHHPTTLCSRCLSHASSHAFSHASQITIGRSAILRTLTLWAVLYGLYRKTSLLDTQTPAWDPAVLTPTENCAGSIYGQELYRLLLVDTLAFAVTISAYHIGMYRFW